MKIAIDFDAVRVRRVFKGAAALGLVAGMFFPGWLVASQLTGLLVFHPGETIRAADFNENFQLVQTAVNDTDNKVTTVSTQVTTLSTDVTTLSATVAPLPGEVSTLQGQVTPLPGQVSTLQGLVTGLQNQVTTLQAQNTSLLARLNAVQALTIVGVPDTSLGPKGELTTTTPGWVTGMVIDSSGRVVITGSIPTGPTQFPGGGMFLLRLNADGTPDGNFGSSGLVLGGQSSTMGQAVVLDSTGRIVVLGGNGTTSVDLWRYLSDGTPDPSFGGGSGFVSVPGGFAAVTPSAATPLAGLALDSGGRIFACGTSGSTPAATVWCFTGAGVLDTTFNGTGIVQGPANTLGNAVAVDSNQNVVVTGGTGTNMAIWRFTPTGGLDSTFNSGTGTFVDFVAATNSVGTAIVLDASNRIVVAGTSGNSTFMCVWRLFPNGALDANFHPELPSGAVTSFGGGGQQIVSGVALDLAGRIVVGGETQLADAAVWRILPSGEIDTTFGAGAGFAEILTPNIESFTVGFALDPAGRPTVSGTGTTGHPVGVYRFD
jgi:uncharacterized delta-60 repeat protein